MSNRLEPKDRIKVEIFNANGDKVSTYKGSGFSRIGDAIEAAFEADMPSVADIRSYVYIVSNIESGTSERYRIDTGGEARLIV